MLSAASDAAAAVSAALHARHATPCICSRFDSMASALPLHARQRRNHPSRRGARLVDAPLQVGDRVKRARGAQQSSVIKVRKRSTPAIDLLRLSIQKHSATLFRRLGSGSQCSVLDPQPSRFDSYQNCASFKLKSSYIPYLRLRRRHRSSI